MSEELPSPEYTCVASDDVLNFIHTTTTSDSFTAVQLFVPKFRRFGCTIDNDGENVCDDDGDEFFDKCRSAIASALRQNLDRVIINL